MNDKQNETAKTWDQLRLMIDGTEYKAKPAKVRLYREIMAFEDQKHTLERSQRDEKMLTILVDTFGVPEDKIEEMDAADLLPTYHDVVGCLIRAMVSKLDALPNEEAPEAVAAE